MPKIVDGVEMYTADEVRSDFVPKSAHLERLAAKDKAVKSAESKVLDLSTQLRDASAASERLQALEGELATERDNAALRTAGLDPASGEDVSWLRMAHTHYIDSLPEDKRPDDAGADFRRWVQAEDGARAHRHTAHLFKGAADPKAAGASEPPPAGTAPPQAAPDVAHLVSALQALGVKVDPSAAGAAPQVPPPPRQPPVTSSPSPAPGQRSPTDPRSIQKRLRAVADNAGLSRTEKHAEIAKIRAELPGG